MPRHRKGKTKGNAKKGNRITATKNKGSKPTDGAKEPQSTLTRGFRGALGKLERGPSVLENRGVYNEAIDSLNTIIPNNIAEKSAAERNKIIKELRESVDDLPDYFGKYVGPATQSYLDTLDPTLAVIRTEINRLQEVAPEPSAEAITTALTQLYQETIDGLDAQQQVAVVAGIRDMIDRLPRFYRDRLANQAHKALNAFDKQIGIPGASFLAPSRIPHSEVTGEESTGPDEYQHISNRGIQQLVRIEGELYTPVYMAVVSDSSTGKSHPKYKDFTQADQGVVQIHTGGGDTDEATLWVSFGRPLRQLKWLELYNYRDNADPLLRSFLIPARLANLLSAETATEHNTSGIPVDLNVDKHYERNQIGIRSPRSLELLRQFALPGSLRTYHVGGERNDAPESWGDVRQVDELRDRMGIPQQILTNRPIFTDAQKQEFAKQKTFKGEADDLSRMYAYYENNPELLPEDESGDQEAMPWFFQRWYSSYNFHRQFNPDVANISMDAFFKQYVAPWATQAQIAKMVADDYEELAQSPEQVPDKPPEVVYNPDPGLSRTGERRSAAVALSGRVQRILSARFQLLSSIADVQAKITRVFADKSRPDSTVRTVMGKLSQTLKRIKDDYPFRAGDLDTVSKQLPVYREEILAYITQLKSRQEADDRVGDLIINLEQALLNEIPTLFSLDSSDDTGRV